MTNTLPQIIKFSSSDRVLFLTKDLNLIEKQLYEGLNLSMKDLSPKDLLDDINTDVMTPAWVCFHHQPEEIAKRAYAGLMKNGHRIFRDGALIEGKFTAIVSGERKGVGSSRETAAQCERYSGIRLVFAESFAPIHRRNNINLGQIMGSYEQLMRLQAGEAIDIDELLAPLDEFSQNIVKCGGLFGFLRRLKEIQPSNRDSEMAMQSMTMAEKIMVEKLVGDDRAALFQHQTTIARVDAGYSHEFTSAQVHQFLREEYGHDYHIQNPQRFAAFEDHLIYTDDVSKFAPFKPLIEELRTLQNEFIVKNGLKDYSAKNGISPGICHEVAREDMIVPGDFILATDSHTCMGGALGAFAFGIGATEYAAMLATGLAVIDVPPTIRFDLVGRLKENCTAKDIMLFILKNYSKVGITLNKVLEFGGEGLHALSLDERATICNMATECGAKTGICEPDDRLVEWIVEHRPGVKKEEIASKMRFPDPDCRYSARYQIDLATLMPMVAHPGDPDRGQPSDPTNGELVANLGDVAIDIAYGGSCTAGKFEDIDMYARVTKHALSRGETIKPGVRFFIQYGSKKVADYADERGYTKDFRRAGITVISPGCGACIGCGPGVSEHAGDVTVSAINRNYQGRSGPGKLYLASPLTVAASAFAGKIVAWQGFTKASP